MNVKSIVVGVLVLGCGAVYAQQCAPQGTEGEGLHRGWGGGRMGCPPMGFNPEAAKKAGASEEQIQTLSDFQLDQQLQRIDLQANAEKAELKLGVLLKAKAVDAKAIMQAVDTLNQARGELFKLEITSLLKAKQVLGVEVFRKLQPSAPPPMGPGMPGMSGGRGGAMQGHDRDEGPGHLSDAK